MGDWIVGTGSAYKKRTGHIVYAMRVSETMSFDQYWADPRFRSKRPTLRGSRKQAFGDNIYHKDPNTDQWLQVDSHHCHDDGTPNSRNIDNDTQTDRILIGEDFIYWGGGGLKFQNFTGLTFAKKVRGTSPISLTRKSRLLSNGCVPSGKAGTSGSR